MNDNKDKELHELLERTNRSWKVGFAQKLISLGVSSECKECLEKEFPELAESEDERIRKWILELVSISGNGNDWEEINAWLEKQKDTENFKEAEEQKNDFVSGQFLQCKLSFDEFKEGEHYWLEYIGDDMYVGRSDNILNQKFHITPRQLYTLFSQKLEEVQGPSQEEKQVSLNYEPPFDENPSDKKIIEALIHCLNEQDGFLTAINCVSTKAILNWLEKQKEQKPVEWDEYTKTNLDRALMIIKSARGKLQGYQSNDGIYECDKAIECIEHILYRGINIEKPAEWSEEDEKVIELAIDCVRAWEIDYCNGDNTISERLKSLRPSWKPNDEDEDSKNSK